MRRALAAALAVLAFAPAIGRAESIALTGSRQVVLVNLTGGLPGRWLACASRCRGGDPVGTRLDGTLLRPVAGGGRLEWSIDGDEAATRALSDLEYTADVLRNQRGTTVLLTATEPWDGIRLVHRYSLAPDGRMLQASLQMPAGAGLSLRGGRDYAPDPLPGLGALYSDVRPVELGEWHGVRGRFWALLARADQGLRVTANEPVDDEPIVRLARGSVGGGVLALEWYAGPVEQAELQAVDPELSGLLYARLWEPLRQLSLGLAWILARWQTLVGNWGVAILLLSLTVKLLMAPLIWFAERWQADVNRTQSLLAPELAAIKRDYQGEEAHERTLAVYRKHGVSMFYTVKSLAGFLIQIPVFIAAFDMLGEFFGLHGASFLWVDDLAAPDRLVALPGVLPFFGGHLNLLPFVMTALTVLAAWRQEEPSLAPELRAAQRVRLYAMAAVFFVLLYTFPAGMVLYWTANNLWHLVRVLLGRLLPASS
jgi:YidC/Oxa1 family membrane protein insertase